MDRRSRLYGSPALPWTIVYPTRSWSTRVRSVRAADPDGRGLRDVRAQPGRVALDDVARWSPTSLRAGS